MASPEYAGVVDALHTVEMECSKEESCGMRLRVCKLCGTPLLAGHSDECPMRIVSKYVAEATVGGGESESVAGTELYVQSLRCLEVAWQCETELKRLVRTMDPKAVHELRMKDSGLGAVTERGRKPVDVTVEVAGGVASVQCFREGVVVEVRDYDCVEDAEYFQKPTGGDDPHVIRDESGRRCWRYFTEKSKD